jgi:hypothetical protein
MLTAERARELLHYDAETGVFTWRKSRRGVRPGKCGRVSPVHGYLDIRVDGVYCRAHRLAFLYMTGAFPPGDVDHINGNPSDNRWANLRPATRTQNSINCRVRKNNTSGAHNVVWDAPRQKWRAQIRIDGRRVNLGRFSEKEDAIRAYAAAAAKHHGAFVPSHALTHEDARNQYAEGIRPGA